MQRRALGLACCGLLLVACGDGRAVGAGPADPDAVLANGMSARQTVEARALHMKDLGGSFKAVRDQTAQEPPNLSLVQIATKEVEFASQELPSWFPAGTGPETGLKMRAFAEIWTDEANFAAAANEFRTQAKRLNELAQAGDLAGVREQTRAVRKTCGGCHDSYRAPPPTKDPTPSDG
jgi:cytochrome c556